jgi:hypothetical protein
MMNKLIEHTTQILDSLNIPPSLGAVIVKDVQKVLNGQDNNIHELLKSMVNDL